MLLVVDALNKHRFGAILDEMYQLRARVFRDRMGWDVNVRNGREIDLFDGLDPAYVITLNDTYGVTGCARLLQTTGPHMLSDVFFDILDGEPPLRSATVWESTRFCVDRQRLSGGHGKNTVSYTTSELMVGIMEYAKSAGIADIITVIDPLMDRILHRSDNAPYGYVGKTADMGKVKALAALIDCSSERISKVRAFAGIDGDIFAPEEEVAAALAPTPDAAMNPELKTYMRDQIASAETDRERAAAIALQNALSGTETPGSRAFDA
ncbi:acyl-homoserine-lactone synthase [Roseovarius rhodophyticola]|uniref:Acyl-homoserine-lactone synthase n=1 Tax=Roseovarius rhodophyticola TaxID=3080827 RepID=A0ABZ2TFC0_9RHOB|nr:acyl-homoserine-lactone synthase [Roseovarius sp. W115]MDV2928606.1 acyl-homoserine-lactone synthase [Roseovarius sp. W115]